MGKFMVTLWKELVRLRQLMEQKSIVDEQNKR